VRVNKERESRIAKREREGEEEKEQNEDRQDKTNLDGK
jgi:hypothetical protein